MSKYNYEYSPTYSDNPYIDILVNCVKILGANAVVKNENQALRYEDPRSSTLSGDYIKYMSGAWDKINNGPYNPDDYFEFNSYYRMLYGLPPAYTMYEENAYLSATGYTDSDDGVYEYATSTTRVITELYKRYWIDMGKYSDEYEGRYLHELTNDELTIISSDGGILDQIKQEYGEDPKYQYIYHLGDKRIDYYTARIAANFALLYIPKLGTYDIIEDKFRRCFDRNRKYTISTIYSEAYRFMSYHYDAFIQILIIIQTMVDIISEVQEYIINKDVLDSRTIRYLFESYGIAYYKEIPIKYQIRIIKNVNKLIKYKSSNQNIMDILELFDDDSITIYTYYLMKIKKLNKEDFYYYTEQDINYKYIKTDKTVYIGDVSDEDNNKLPIMNVPTTEDDTIPTTNSGGVIIKDNFIKTHLYNYQLRETYLPDTYANREILSYMEQPVVSKISESLKTTEYEESLNSSLTLEFMNKIALFNNLPWFGMERFNPDPSVYKDKSYLVQRNEYLTKLKQALSLYIAEDLHNNPFGEPLGLNKYNYKRIKYCLYGLLGIFDYDDSIDYENTPDVELESRFYHRDDLITIAYCEKHGISYREYQYFIQSEDRYILNHSIPFMVWNNYKANLDNEDLSREELYIFNTDNGYISATKSKLGDLYERYTRTYRDNYIIMIRLIVDAVFSDFNIDEEDNPSPRYDGWLDTAYVTNKLHKDVDELQLNDRLDIDKSDNAIMYSTARTYTQVTEDMIGMENYRKNYDLCFLKVPVLDSNAYAVIESKEARRSYDSVTLDDPFWDGISEYDILTDEEKQDIHETNKQDILSKEFNVERTKYLAVESDMDLVKMSYQVSYFMNMLYDKFKDEELLMVPVDPELSSDKVRLNDLLTFAIALNFLYNGTEPDNIASDMEKNMYINGFNFETDWNDIYNYLDNHHFIGDNYNNKIHDYTYVDEFGNIHEVTGYGMEPFKKGYMTELYDDTVVYGTAYYPPEGKVIEAKKYFGYPMYGYDADGNPIFPYDDSTHSDVEINFVLLGDMDDWTAVKFPAYVYERHSHFIITHEPENPEEDKLVMPSFNSLKELWSFYEKGGTSNNRIPTPDRTVMPDSHVGAFLCGRYEEVESDKYDYKWSEIWDYNLKHHVVITAEFLKILDISWDTPYLDNNSRGLWMNTGILNSMSADSSDLDRINKLKDIYTHNTNVYNHLVYMMNHAESKRMYDVYKIVFDSFMYTKMNHEYYIMEDTSGNTLYTNVNDDDETFYLTTEDITNQDDNGFPVFSGYNIYAGSSALYMFDYSTAIDSNFDVCRYKRIDLNEYHDCIRNVTGDYEVFYNDSILNLSRDTYFCPSADNISFSVATKTLYYMVDKADEKIKIPIELDEEGNPIIFEEGYKWVVRTNHDGSYMTDEDGNYIIVKVPEMVLLEGKSIVFDKKVAKDYYEFLEFRNPALYAHLMDLKNNYVNIQITDDTGSVMYTPDEAKRNRIEELCEYIVDALDDYFDKNEWLYMYNIIPTTNIQNIRSYIMKMVVFFKSWKTQVLNASVNYKIDDPFNNYVHILDDMYHSSTYMYRDKISLRDYKYFQNKSIWNDVIGISDDITMIDIPFEPYIVYFGFGEKLYGHNFEYMEYKISTIWKDAIEVIDDVIMTDISFEPYKVDFGFAEKLYGNNFDYMSYTSKLTTNELVQPGDKVDISIVTYTGDIQEDNNGNLLLP